MKRTKLDLHPKVISFTDSIQHAEVQRVHVYMELSPVNTGDASRNVSPGTHRPHTVPPAACKATWSQSSGLPQGTRGWSPVGISRARQRQANLPAGACLSISGVKQRRNMYIHVACTYRQDPVEFPLDYSSLRSSYTSFVQMGTSPGPVL